MLVYAIEQGGYGAGVVILTYANRKGMEHYLHVRKSKTGGDRFCFSSRAKGPFLDRVPEGYEIHESPNGRVSVRLGKFVKHLGKESFYELD